MIHASKVGQLPERKKKLKVIQQLEMEKIHMYDNHISFNLYWAINMDKKWPIRTNK